MPCVTNPDRSPAKKSAQVQALERLRAALAAGTVQLVVGRSGSIAFRGWAAEQREDVSDLCAYRAIQHDPVVRRALIRAEAMSGNRMDPRAIAAGTHSHDGGATWGSH